MPPERRRAGAVAASALVAVAAVLTVVIVAVMPVVAMVTVAITPAIVVMVAMAVATCSQQYNSNQRKACKTVCHEIGP